MICGLALLKQLKIDEAQFICFYPKRSHLAYCQTKNTAEYLQLKNYTIYPLPANPTLRSILSLVIPLTSIFRPFSRSTRLRLAFGDFFNTPFHFLRLFFPPSCTYVLDDGFSSYWALTGNLGKQRYMPSSTNKGFGGVLSSYLSSKPFYFYTIYSSYFPSQLYCSHLNISTVLPGATDQRIAQGTIYIAGTKLSERKVTNLQDEVKILENIYDKLTSRYREIVYIAKRSTSTEKLSLIQELGLSVTIPDLPFELFLADSPVLPQSVLTFGSTLNESLHQLFPKVQLLYMNLWAEFPMLMGSPEESHFLDSYFNQITFPVESFSIRTSR